MPKYKVPAEMITDLFIEVEADSSEEAYQKAREADGSDFLEYPQPSGDWRIGEPQLMEDKDAKPQ